MPGSACDAWSVGRYLTDAGSQTLALRLGPPGGAINQTPVVVATANPQSGPSPLTVQFSSAGSYDPDGSIASYFWEFGDSATSTSTEPNPVHTYYYDGPGTFYARLTITDNQGGHAGLAIPITITVPPPEVHVQAQTVTRVSAGRNQLAGQDVVVIWNQNNQPVYGATVYVNYTGPTQGTSSGATGSGGSVTLTTKPARRPSGEWCFEVTNVVASGYTYNPSKNVVTKQCESGPVF